MAENGPLRSKFSKANDKLALLALTYFIVSVLVNKYNGSCNYINNPYAKL